MKHKIYYFHSKVEDDKRGRRVSVGGYFDDHHLKIFIARCSNKDNFSKKVSRKIIQNRIEKNIFFKKFHFDVDAAHDKPKFFMHHVLKLLKNKELFNESPKKNYKKPVKREKLGLID